MMKFGQIRHIINLFIVLKLPSQSIFINFKVLNHLFDRIFDVKPCWENTFWLSCRKNQLEIPCRHLEISRWK